MGRILVLYSIAAAIRYFLFMSEYQEVIAKRVEISTPLNAWKRIVEGVHLVSNNIDPYQGDYFHETPVNLYLYKWLIETLGHWLPFLFILCDILTAQFLRMTARAYLRRLKAQQDAEKQSYSSNTDLLLLTEDDCDRQPFYVATAYLFNPYLLFNCVGMTSTVFANLNLAIVCLGIAKSCTVLSCAFLAICTFQSFYPVMLLVPLVISIHAESKSRPRCILAVAIFCTFLAGLVLCSRHLAGHWHFLDNTFGFILTVPDFRPNIGLFWYFFTEMFEHFRDLFIWSFQINATILYLVPLTFRFRKDPVLLTYSLVTLTAIFKSYPSLGDTGFSIALLPMWRQVFIYMQQSFILSCMFLVTSILGPIVWYLWIYSFSANANFYFGVTLAFATAQIFMITDVLFAYVKRAFTLKYGFRRKVNGKVAKLILK